MSVRGGRKVSGGARALVNTAQLAGRQGLKKALPGLIDISSLPNPHKTFHLPPAFGLEQSPPAQTPPRPLPPFNID